MIFFCREMMVLKGRMVCLVVLVCRVTQDNRDHLDHQENLGLRYQDIDSSSGCFI